MRLPWATRALAAISAGVLLGCGSVGPTVNGTQNQNDDCNPYVNSNCNNQNWNTPLPDATVGDFVHVRGIVWSPGADLPETLEVNRFPIPGAAVIAYASPPPDLPQGVYCNECVQIPSSTPHAITEVDGSFELDLMPGFTYYLTIQKGEFRRVTQFNVPNAPGEVWEISFTPGQPRPHELTLPVRTDPASGDNVPKIAVITANYEDMDIMFSALGFQYDGVDVDEVDPSIVNDESALNQYNIVIVPCGENWPGGNGDVLRRWVQNGGKLYVDDFNYDFVEQIWPEFLSWYVYDDMGGFGGTGPCGTGSPGSVGECNNWSSYDFNGDPGDPDLAAWLALPEVNQGSAIYLQAAWDYIYQLGEGVVGTTDEECPTSHCEPNGTNLDVYAEPKVWMYNNDGAGFDSHPPATVSWPYHCGKVLYTVYHTHSGYEEPYELLLQEKIMMYLIMEIQTCSTGPIVQ